MKKNDGFIPLWALLVALGVIVVAGGVWYLNSSSGTKVFDPSPNDPIWRVYTDTANGFEVKYPTGVTLQEQNGDVSLSFPGDKARIYLKVTNTLSAPLFGTFGGWYQYNKAAGSPNLVSTGTIGNFAVDYFMQDAGMGSWDRAINAYQTKNGTYYELSLYYPREFSVPAGADHQAAIAEASADLHDLNNAYVKTFTKILNTFRFTLPQGVEKKTWNGMTFDYPAGWTVREDTYATPAQTAEGTPPSVVGLSIEKVTGAEQYFIEIGGRQADCRGNSGYAKCVTIQTPDKQLWPVHTINRDSDTLSVFDSIVQSIVQHGGAIYRY